jgi:hypothetical protein
MERGLNETLLKNLNYVPVLGVVEYFDKILLQNKRKGVESGFSRSHNVHLRYRIGERL